ncbi:MAG: XRE family transcriptional regulator [Scytonema sp. PMC 1069.18]|nr:XRE family transcriptional regulator [Scytonema sp. PMC 1069.18]MEC4881759.1 XRE family transcriptional regulator [Scytonema sp. PMC 1070.18]
MAISSNLIQKILLLLTQILRDEKDCQTYLTKTLGINETISKRIAWNTSKDIFITDMVKILDIYGEVTPGKPALCALLTEIRKDVGVDIQIDIDKIITELTGVKTPPHLLFDLLLHMDFKQQVRLVRQVMELHQTAAFLVHGEPYYGQQLLVTRLFRLKSEWKNISPIKINVSHNGAGRSVPLLWRQLTSWFGLPKDAEPKQIIQRICDRFSTQDVIFIFYTIDYMPPKVLAVWVEEFWGTLVTQVEANCPPTQQGRHLLMFLVDNSGSVCNSNILLAKQFDEPEYPRIPLHLPPINPFPVDVLDDWIEMVMAMQTIEIPTGLTPKTLLEMSENGIPEFVYEEICCHCGHSWEGGLAKWLI